ncbi:MAG: MarR family transcriptional regulator [Nanoarchaeota archaeon]|nr:MarR family transcriptional regulator [Nanoarchaeota archaeon]
MNLLEWLFGTKRGETFEEEVRHSFSNVKKDIHKVSKWLSHFHDKHKKHEDNVSDVLKRMEKIEKDLDEVKTFVEFFVSETSRGPFRSPFKQLSKHTQTAVQTGGVQTAVQTAVQTGIQTSALKGLTMMERMVLFALLNSNEKLSYDDIAVLTGKDKSTVRGQINNIKQKSEGLISEIVESSGKKRYFIEEKLKERVLDDIIMAKKRKSGQNKVNFAEKPIRKRKK